MSTTDVAQGIATQPKNREAALSKKQDIFFTTKF